MTLSIYGIVSNVYGKAGAFPIYDVILVLPVIFLSCRLIYFSS